MIPCKYDLSQTTNSNNIGLNTRGITSQALDSIIESLNKEERMTRKHFVLIAKELNEARKYIGESEDFKEAVRAVTNALTEINPRFDSEKFRKAVGL